MGTIVRGIKNAFRNGVRTVAIIVILTASISMALVMFMALKTVNGKIESVKSSVGNTITVSPAGIRGFEGGGDLITSANATAISKIDGVQGVIESLTDRLRNENSSSSDFGPNTNQNTNATTNLESSVEPGSFGQRQQSFENQSDSSGSQVAQQSQGFSMPITVTGVNKLNNDVLNVSEFNLTSGKNIDPTSSQNVAMVGKDLATKNNLIAGSTFTAYEKTITVAGIYDTGNTFTNASIILPIKTLQTLSDQSGQINSAVVEVNSIDNISSVSQSIKDKLGSSVDVVTSQDKLTQATESLQNIKTISLYSLIGALVAGAIIIFLVMIMIVRERRREIGVLKAIGASNLTITGQFVFESLTLTLISSILGIILGAILSNPILKVLVNNSQSTAENVGRGSGPGGMMRMGLERVGNTFGNLHAVVGIDILLYGLLAAVIIAVIGSAISSFLIAKVRPAEVMRTE